MAQTSQAEPIDPHTIDSKFSEWWQSDKADDATDNPFQPDSAAAWAYAGWMAAQRAEPKRPQTCLWSRSDDDTDVWETTCGNAFTINEGSPADNEMTFCCFCGRELEGETGGSDADN